MKLSWVPCLLLALLSTSCVRSLGPFCPPEACVPAPDLQGGWLVTDKNKSDATNQMWEVTADRIRTRDLNEGTQGMLKPCFFKAGGKLYMDTEPEEPGFLKADGWWSMHIQPLHIVWRVEREGDQLRLIALSQKWMQKLDPARHAGIDCVAFPGEQSSLYSAEPARWLEFLAEHASDTNAFPEDGAVVLRRRPSG